MVSGALVSTVYDLACGTTTTTTRFDFWGGTNVIKLSVNLTGEEHARLVERAAAAGVSKSAWIAACIRAQLYQDGFAPVASKRGLANVDSARQAEIGRIGAAKRWGSRTADDKPSRDPDST